MSVLEKFITENNVEFSGNRVENEFLDSLEKYLNVRIGVQLRKYILEYGYLAYKSVELYGVTAHQALNSDMVKRTAFLHNNFDCTNGFVVLEDAGDGDFFLVDDKDSVFEFIPELGNKLSPLNKPLFTYIYDRFHSLV